MPGIPYLSCPHLRTTLSLLTLLTHSPLMTPKMVSHLLSSTNAHSCLLIPYPLVSPSILFYRSFPLSHSASPIAIYHFTFYTQMIWKTFRTLGHTTLSHTSVPLDTQQRFLKTIQLSTLYILVTFYLTSVRFCLTFTAHLRVFTSVLTTPYPFPQCAITIYYDTILTCLAPHETSTV